MRKSHLLLTLTCCYSSMTLGVAAWSYTHLADAVPTAHAEVKGASTETLAPTLNLQPYPILDATNLPKINAGQYALYDAESGKTVIKSDAMAPVPIASTTKLMTAYLTSKLAKLDTVTTVSHAAASQPSDSSLMYIHENEQITVRNLLYGAMLVSGNDAAYALAEYSGGLLLKDPGASSQEKVARFVEEMNAEAASLRMEDTRYHDPVGYNDEGRSTALDLAKLTAEVIGVDDLRAIVGTPLQTVSDQSGRYRYDLKNSNRLVADYQYEGSIGGKTGFTPEAGHCLITAAKRNGHTLVAAILHTTSDTNEASAVEARKLLDAGFSAISWR